LLGWFVPGVDFTPIKSLNDGWDIRNLNVVLNDFFWDIVAFWKLFKDFLDGCWNFGFVLSEFSSLFVVGVVGFDVGSWFTD
jgi:hypothetical protein